MQEVQQSDVLIYITIHKFKSFKLSLNYSLFHNKLRSHMYFNNIFWRLKKSMLIFLKPLNGLSISLLFSNQLCLAYLTS